MRKRSEPLIHTLGPIVLVVLFVSGVVFLGNPWNRGWVIAHISQSWGESWVAAHELDSIVTSFDPKATCKEEFPTSKLGIPVTCKLAWAGSPGVEIKVTVAAGTATAVKVIQNYAILDAEHPVGLRRNAAGKFVPMTDDSRP